MKLGLVSLGLVAAGAVAVAGALAEASWQEDLSYEIQQIYDCEVAFLSQVVESDIGEKHMIMAKVHCSDQRNFDARRLDSYEPFLFTKCEDHDKSSC